MLKRGAVSLEEASERCRLNLKILRGAVGELEKTGFIVLEGGSVKVEKLWDLLFLVFDIYDFDPEELLEGLDWRFFEEFAYRVLERLGYKVLRNYRFKLGKHRFEVDVIAWRDNIMLAVECKYWRRIGVSKLKLIARKNIEKSEELAKIVERELGFRGEIYPVVLTLKSEPIRVFEGCGIVPVFKLRDFLVEFHNYVNLLNPMPTRKFGF